MWLFPSLQHTIICQSLMGAAGKGRTCAQGSPWAEVPTGRALVLCHPALPLCPLAAVEAGLGMQGGCNNTFWAYTHEPAPQSHSQSPQTAAAPMRHGVSPDPKPWVLPGLVSSVCPGAQSPQPSRKGRGRPTADKSLLAIETFPYRRGCELCKYLLYKSGMWLWRKTKKPLKNLFQIWPQYGFVSSKKWS